VARIVLISERKAVVIVAAVAGRGQSSGRDTNKRCKWSLFSFTLAVRAVCVSSEDGVT